MLFSTNIFVFIFLPTVLLGYYVVLHRQSTRNYFLLIMSLLFYAWGEPVYVLLMLLSIAGNYAFGLAVSKYRAKKPFLILSVIFNLGILFYFKYYNFTLSIINDIFGSSLTASELSMPIGISFFTFQAMSYVIDVYRGTAKVQKNPFYLGLYISFFPQLIAGPIVRYNSVEEQIRERTVNAEKFQSGVCRFIQGFAKKIIIANNVAVAAEAAFALAADGSMSVSMAWLGSLCYTFQIFFDFSGYSDMAIGLGRMFGFEFEENFNYPYISRSVSEFWNRWHISLGHWFRDYVYFPLGGSRVGKAKLLRNLFTVWLLTGIWHGAAWQFIIWGTMYGVIISLEKLSGVPKKFAPRSPAAILYAVLTFLIVNAGWVLFGAESLSAALVQLRCMLGIGAVSVGDASAVFYLREYAVILLFAVLFSTPLLKNLHTRIFAGRTESAVYSVFRAAVYALLFIVSVSFLVLDAHNPFIYFNF